MSVLLEYECPCCGGKVEFDSSLQKMKCPYCETTFDMEAMRQRDQEAKTAPENQPEHIQWQQEKQQFLDEEKSGLKVYACKSCGGEIYTDETTAATHCPYCGNPVIMVGNVTDEWKPDGVIPFKLNKQAAKDALKKHMSGKKLLDKSFAPDSRLEEIKGVYVPFWLFDGTADGEVRYHATKVRTWQTSQHNCTETSHYTVNRAGSMEFRKIPVDGARQIPDDLMESVEPFEFGAVKPFQTGYLSGYFADRYNVESKESQTRAVQRAKSTIADALERTVTGFSEVTAEKSDLRLEKPSVSYVLCPVWLLTSSYQGKNYLFAVNGQTGKIAGNMPLNQKAATGHRVGYTLAIGTVIFLLSMLMFGFDLIAMGFSYFIGFVIANGMVESMEKEVINVAMQEDAGAYASELKLRVSREQFLYSNVKRTPRPKNDPPRGGTGSFHSSYTGNRSGSIPRRPMGAPRPGSRPGGGRPGGGRPGGARPGGNRPRGGPGKR